MRNYKDLRVWDEAHKLTLAVYKATQVLPKEERFGLTSQIRRASASIAANLAEGAGDDPMERWRDSYRLPWDQARSFPITCCWRGISAS